jgi:hypothetical protein
MHWRPEHDETDAGGGSDLESPPKSPFLNLKKHAAITRRGQNRLFCDGK